MFIAPYFLLATVGPLPLIDNVSVSGFSCADPTFVGYRPGTEVTVDCTVPITVTGLAANTAKIRLEAWTVSASSAGGFGLTWSTLKEDEITVDSWIVTSTETFDRQVSLTGTAPDTSEDVELWLAEQYSLGRKLRLAVEVDANHTVLETSELDNTGAPGIIFNGFFLTPLTGVVRFGGVSTTLTEGAVEAVSPGCCSVGALVLSSDAALTWAPGGAFTPIALEAPDLTVSQLSASAASGLTVSATGSVTVPTIATTFTGVQVTLDVALDEKGIKPVSFGLTLPSGVSYHEANVFAGPVARGSSSVTFGTVRLGKRHDLNTIVGTLTGGFLHGGGLPFYLRVTSLGASTKGVGGKHSGPFYQGNVGFLPDDPRSPLLGLPRTTSNELRYGREPLIAQARPTFLLKSTGLFGTVTFGLGAGAMHFPAVSTAWPAFSVVLDSSALKSGSLPADFAVAFEQSPDCPSCPSSAGGVGNTVQPAGKMGVGADGGIVVAVEDVQEPVWGPAGSDAVRVFEREGSSGEGVLYIPGFTLPGTAKPRPGAPPPGVIASSVPPPSATDRSASESLLGSRAVTLKSGVLVPTAHYSLPDSEARRGNHFAAGVTVGPERYADATTGLPKTGVGTDETGSTTRVRFGGPNEPGGCDGAPCDVVGNAGTRYVVRPAGVTGAFNTDTEPAPEVYLYDLPFTRFAFRQVLNGVDPYSWLDGAVAVDTPGGFDVVFTSMTLECTGALGPAHVIPCDSSLGPDSTNCGESLHAWKAPMVPQTLAFVPELDMEDFCDPGGRDLEVGSEVTLAALDKVVGVTAKWTPAGNPTDERVTGGSDNGLERPASPGSDAEDRPFPVALHETVLLEHSGNELGWFVFNMDFAAPFFDMLNADVKVENATESTAAPTVVRQSDGSGSPNKAIDWKNEDPCTLENLGDCAPRAHYTWGGTGFEIDLPVWFDVDEAGERMPRFGGVMLEHSLVVAQVNAGVEYLTPENTRVVFGASADFETLALEDVILAIDVNDVLSVLGVDDLVASLGIPDIGGKGPFEAMIGAVQAEFAELLTLTGDAIIARLREEVELAFDVAIDAVVVSFPTLLDDTVAVVLEVKALPAVLANALVLSLDELLAEALVPFTAALDAELSELLSLFVELSAGAEVAPCDALPDQCIRAREILAAVDDALADAIEALNALADPLVDTDGVDLALNSLDGVIGDAQATVTAGLDLCTTLEVDVLGSGLATFKSPSLTVNPLLILLAATAAPQVQSVLDELKVLEFVENANRLASILPLPIEVDEIESDLVDRALDLLNEANLVIPSFEAELKIQDYSTALTGAVSLVGEVQAGLTGVETELDAVAAEVKPILLTLEEDVADLVHLLEDVRTFIAEVDAMVACAQDPVCGGGVFYGKLEVDIIAALDAQLSAATDGALAVFISLAGDNLVLSLPSVLREPIDVALADVAAEVELALPSLELLPALSTGADLRLALVDLLMASPAVEFLTLSFQNHFDLLTEDVSILVDDLFGHVDDLIADLNASLNNAAADALAKANAAIDELMPELPIQAAQIDGYAQIAGDALERLHVGAEFTMTGSEEDDTRVFGAALDVTSWATNGKGDACAPTDASSMLDAVISAQNLPLKVGPGELTIEDLHLGFTLQGNGSGPPSLIGLFGGITTDGALEFNDFSIYDIAFEAGVGSQETYVGASAGASFSSMAINVSFLVGRTCNDDVLTSLDPQAAEFITLPGGVFNGVYVRGGASIPIIDLGCPLNLGLSADVGSWLLGGPPLTLGGLVGGGGYGKIGCIGALRGQATAFAELSGNVIKFRGEGWGAAGVGLKCDPETWSTLQKSRDDKSCGTGDASLSLTFQNGKWTVPSPKVSAVH